MTNRERRLQVVSETREVFLKKLTEAGADQELAEKVCFSMQQRQAMELTEEGIRRVAGEVYERFLKGDLDEPGPVLAEKLLDEYWGKPRSRAKALEWLLATS